MDTVCVELRFSDGSICSIDTIAVENEVARNMHDAASRNGLHITRKQIMQTSCSGVSEQCDGILYTRITIWKIAHPNTHVRLQGLECFKTSRN